MSDYEVPVLGAYDGSDDGSDDSIGDIQPEEAGSQAAFNDNFDDYASSSDDDEDHENEGMEENQPEADGDPFLQFDAAHWKAQFGPNRITLGEILLLVMAHYIQFSTSDTELVAIFKLINLVIGQDLLPSTTHLMKKLFECCFGNLKIHFFCRECIRYLTEVSLSEARSNNGFECPNCHCENVLNIKFKNYFIMFDVTFQLKEIFKQTNIINYIDGLCRNENCITDVYEGSLYAKLLDPNERVVSYNFNIDAAPVFNSSKISITPIQLCLNELPPHLRAMNLVVAGLWVGTGEPKMDVYLKPFAEMSKKLAVEGLDFIHENSAINVKVRPFCCAVDSVAKPLLQNMKQYNGYDACPICYHPGCQVHGQVRYLNLEEEPAHRQDDEFLSDMRAAFYKNEEDPTREHTVRGIKGPSYLATVPFFFMVSSFSIDYLHAVLLGVVRYFLELWLTKVRAPFYMGTPQKLRYISKVLSDMQLPSEIGRVTRGVADRRNWKGQEWKMWLLVYSLPIICELMPSVYSNHWSLLVKSIFILSGPGITQNDLDECNDMLRLFAIGVQELYGEEFMLFNVHLLTHMPHMVSKCGPLFACSTFPFESELFAFKKMVKSGNGVTWQIGRKISIRTFLPMIARKFEISPAVQEMVKKIVKTNVQREASIPHVLQSNVVDLCDAEVEVLRQAGFVNFDELHLCKSAKINRGQLYLQSYYVREDYKNCIVKLKCGRVCVIKKIFYIVSPHTENNFFCLVSQCRLQEFKVGDVTLPNMQKSSGLVNQLRIICVSSIHLKCIKINVGNTVYIVELPIGYETQ